MADNVDVTPGSGATIATDQVDTAHYQYIKPAFGPDGTAIKVSSSDPFPVYFPSAQAVTVSGVATAAHQITAQSSLDAIKTALEIIDDWDETNRAAVNTVSSQVGVQGGSGAVSANTQRVVLATDIGLPAGNNNIGDIDVATIAAGTNNIGDMDILSLTDTQSSFDHGSNLDIDASAEQITSTSFTAKRGVVLRAPSANTGIIYVGNSDVTAGTTAATDGIPLEPGESLFIEIDNPNKLYGIADVANQKIFWSAI